MNLIKYFLVPLFFLIIFKACHVESENKKKVIMNQISENKFPQLVLYEDSINGITLPFPKKKMLKYLNEELFHYQVIQEIGQQDGPDFQLYSVRKNNEELLFFAMDSEDTLRLNDVYVKSPLVQDVYGLRVGDSYNSIIKNRNNKFNNYTDYHQHTYLYNDSSSIMYEIEGDLTLPDTVELENIQLTEAQIKDWKIEYIIWRNKNK